MQNDRRRESWLPESHEFTRLILENSPDFLGLLDAAGRFLMINEAGLRCLGVGDVSAAYGKEWRVLWPKRARPQVDLAVAAANSEGKGRFCEWCPTAKGELRYWDVIITRLPEAGGGVARFLTVSRDITEIKRMEDALKWSARRSALTSEAAGALLQSDNPRTVIERLCQNAMADLDCQFFFNFLFDRHTGSLHLNAFAGVPEQEAHLYERLDYETVLRGCVVRDCESKGACTAHNLRAKLRESYGVTSYCCYPLIAPGRVIGTLSFGSRTRPEFNDSEIEVMETLSQFVSIAIARAEMEQALRESDRRKDEFIATLAHELRNPLAAIRNGFNVLNETGGAALPRLRPMLDRQLGLLVRLVDDLLETARIKTGKIELKKQRVDLASAINESIQSSEPLLRDRAHNVTVRLPSEALFVEGDPARLVQVFVNLIDNAAKYTALNGRIEVSAARYDAEAVVSVRDNGAGIPAEKLDSIFDMFSQIGSRPDDSLGGLGIGLNLARGLIEQHGGTLEARSGGLGCGSEFLVRLPLLSPSPDEEEDKNEVAICSTPAACRALVVDDNRDAADSLVMLLRSLGAETRVTYSGEEALKLIAEFKPHLVMLDIGMPRMDGYETARRIRELPEGRSLLLAALSGWGTDQARSTEVGFDRHFVKPITIEALQQVVLEAEEGV
jgi:PAS domain S-box-containing protein